MHMIPCWGQWLLFSKKLLQFRVAIHSKSSQKYETKFRKDEKHPGKRSNVHSSKKYLLSAKYVPGRDLVARDTAVTEPTFKKRGVIWK